METHLHSSGGEKSHYYSSFINAWRHWDNEGPHGMHVLVADSFGQFTSLEALGNVWLSPSTSVHFNNHFGYGHRCLGSMMPESFVLVLGFRWHCLGRHGWPGSNQDSVGFLCSHTVNKVLLDDETEQSTGKEKILIRADMWLCHASTSMFIAARFTIAKLWNQPCVLQQMNG